MWDNFITVIKEYFGKTTYIMILCIIIGITGMFLSTKIFVTNEKLETTKICIYTDFKASIDNTRMELDQAVKRGKIEHLYIKKEILERAIWEIDAKLEDSKDKDKWNRRLARAEKELEEVNKLLSQSTIN